jgi:hypothetical protein
MCKKAVRIIPVCAFLILIAIGWTFPAKEPPPANLYSPIDETGAVPNIILIHVSEARAILTRYGLEIGKIEYVDVEADYGKDIVLVQVPRGGEPIPEDGKINLTLSKPGEPYLKISANYFGPEIVSLRNPAKIDFLIIAAMKVELTSMKIVESPKKAVLLQMEPGTYLGLFRHPGDYRVQAIGVDDAGKQYADEMVLTFLSEDKLQKELGAVWDKFNSRVDSITKNDRSSIENLVTQDFNDSLDSYLEQFDLDEDFRERIKLICKVKILKCDGTEAKCLGLIDSKNQNIIMTTPDIEFVKSNEGNWRLSKVSFVH